jgi:hypothetical protein
MAGSSKDSSKDSSEDWKRTILKPYHSETLHHPETLHHHETLHHTPYPLTLRHLEEARSRDGAAVFHERGARRQQRPDTPHL